MLRNDLLRERKRGGAIDYTTGSTLDDSRRLFADSLQRQSDKFDAAIEVFLSTRRFSTIAPGIHFLSSQNVDRAAIAERLVAAGKRKNVDRALNDIKIVIDALDDTEFAFSVG